MRQFWIFLKREWMEQVRGFKLIWVPLVFIFFGALEPLTYHFMPQILESVGNLPDGAEFNLPDMTGGDILMSLTGQYQMIGTLVLVLAFMAALSGERKSGAGTLLYVRPISYAAYFTSKWLSASLLGTLSVWLGYGMAMTYVIQLYDRYPDAGSIMRFLAVYSIWILLVITLTVAASAALPTGGAAGAALGILFIGQIVQGMFGSHWTWSPWKLPEYGMAFLDGGPETGGLTGAVAVSAVLIFLLVVFGSVAARRNASRAKV
ncbi:ABC transporter permease [Bhargavaea ullalensis]|uniref:ABC-2 type transport system permease protein n=1 Tax=Bhargavaea ullalensis TaxID=1265685 RepID=A0ABV2GEZ1_9BACL